jgi:hypothetical protein
MVNRSAEGFIEAANELPVMITPPVTKMDFFTNDLLSITTEYE